MPDTVTFGLDGKLYRQTTGTREAWPASGGAPDLEVIDNCKDLTMTIEKDEWDATTRAALGWEVIATKLKKANIEFTMLWKKSDPGFAAIKTAFLNDGTIAIAVLDDESDAAGAEGLWADFEVLKFGRNEPLREGMTVPVTLKPAASDVAPEWVVVAT